MAPRPVPRSTESNLQQTSDSRCSEEPPSPSPGRAGRERPGAAGRRAAHRVEAPRALHLHTHPKPVCREPGAGGGRRRRVSAASRGHAVRLHELGRLRAALCGVSRVPHPPPPAHHGHSVGRALCDPAFLVSSARATGPTVAVSLLNWNCTGCATRIDQRQRCEYTRTKQRHLALRRPLEGSEGIPMLY